MHIPDVQDQQVPLPEAAPPHQLLGPAGAEPSWQA
jgi:hypothetical protein